MVIFFYHTQEGLAAQEKVDELSKEVKSLREENKTLSDNYNSERVSYSMWIFSWRIKPKCPKVEMPPAARSEERDGFSRCLAVFLH